MDEPVRPDPGTDATIELLARARLGDRSALDCLFARHLPLLRRWASGRLPRWARDITDTSDLVQETVLTALRNLDAFEPRGEGALQAYLRTAIVNRIRNEFRRASRSPAPVELDATMPDEVASPLETAIGSRLLDDYDAALDRLNPEDREAIVTRIELGLSYAEMAEALGKPSANAARMAVARALVRLAGEMKI